MTVKIEPNPKSEHHPPIANHLRTTTNPPTTGYLPPLINHQSAKLTHR
jgi:hypothetical protein